MKNKVYCASRMCALILFSNLLFLLFSCSGKTHSPKKVPEKDTISYYGLKVNVFMENSGSMDGYVSGSTEFEDIVYDYLTTIKGMTYFDNLPNNPIDSLNLFYINSQVLDQGHDVKQFIQDMEPGVFKKKGGKHSNTDIGEVLNSVLAMSDSTTISIFISDCIFSPGSGTNAINYLNKQSTSIMGSFYDYIKKKDPNFCVLVYRFLSNFNGNYYDCNNAVTKINDQRPFYMWVMGGKKYIRGLLSNLRNYNFKGAGIQNQYLVYSSPEEVKYSVRKPSGSDKYELDKNNRKTTVKNLKKNKDGLYSFSIDVNYSNLMLSSDYLEDTRSYSASDTTYRMMVNEVKKEGYTHVIKLSNERLKKGQFILEVNKTLPSWIDEFNDNNGVGINSESMSKTFGISYLLRGVSEAFTRDNDYYSKIDITIK